MLDKSCVLTILEEYSFDPSEFIILSGASMVLQGVKTETKDIDIAVSQKMAESLLNSYKCTLEKIDPESRLPVYYLGEFINFSVHYYGEVESELISGYNLQTLKSIIELKQKLNREKDLDDIKLILSKIK